jgi:hypothetical protein
MTPPPVVVLIPVPYPVPVGSGNNGWQRRPLPPQYPRQGRERWPLKTSVPVRDLKAVRDMPADARRIIAQQRAREL